MTSLDTTLAEIQTIEKSIKDPPEGEPAKPDGEKSERDEIFPSQPEAPAPEVVAKAREAITKAGTSYGKACATVRAVALMMDGASGLLWDAQDVTPEIAEHLSHAIKMLEPFTTATQKRDATTKREPEPVAKGAGRTVPTAGAQKEADEGWPPDLNTPGFMQRQSSAGDAGWGRDGEKPPVA